MTLIDTTNALLKDRLNGGLSLRQIAESSAGTVEVEWLYKFAKGGIPDPSVNRIQALHDHLKRLPRRAA